MVVEATGGLGVLGVLGVTGGTEVGLDLGIETRWWAPQDAPTTASADSSTTIRALRTI